MLHPFLAKKMMQQYNFFTNLVIGLKPFVTIFHWDTPLALEEKYGGFLSEKIMYGCASCQIIDNHN